jgi:hypothetical protein
MTDATNATLARRVVRAELKLAAAHDKLGILLRELVAAWAALGHPDGPDGEQRLCEAIRNRLEWR